MILAAIVAPSVLVLKPNRLTAEPFRRHHHQRREQYHQEQHDELRDHEGPDALDDVFHADVGNPADDVQHHPHRRCDQADRIVDDEQHPEIDRIDSGGLDDRHKD